DLVDVPPALDVQVSHLTADSRDVVPGSVFIALSGLNRDGGQFVVEAIARGARAVVRDGVQHQVEIADGIVQVALKDLRAAIGQMAQRFCGDTSARSPVMGVTGTNGKSSTTHYIAQMLAQIGQPCGLSGTLGYGLPPHLRDASHTTPDCLRLHAELADM